MKRLDLKQLFKNYWNKRLQIITIVLVFLIIGSIYSFAFVKPKYQSYTTLLLVQAGASEEDNDTTSNKKITQSDLNLNQELISAYSELVKTKNVLREVIRDLKLRINEEELMKNITVNSVKDTGIINITVTSSNALDAKNIANQIAKILSQRVSTWYQIDNINIIDEAEEATAPYNISHMRDIIIFMAIGLVVAIIYVLMANLFDTTVKTAEEIEKELEISVLLSIPEVREDSNISIYEKGGIY